MAGEPLEVLNGKTTMEAANTPNMDYLASIGEIGTTSNVPKGMPPGSDVATMSIMGYNPATEYTGRAPLEALAMRIPLADTDIVYRCNMVSIKHNVMEDFTAHHIETVKSHQIIEALNKELSTDSIRFYPGVSYRHALVIKNGPLKLDCTPPHDITDREITRFLPKGEGAEIINELMEKSKSIVAKHNTAATQIWLWGQGTKPKFAPLTEKYHLTGYVITAVDLLKGIGLASGLEPVDVPGATGFVDTNYQGKVDAAKEGLAKGDFVVIHLEAADESGHMGDYKLKIQSIEDFDEKVVGPLYEEIQKYDDFKILILPDHPTPIRIKTHSSDPVPFIFLNRKYLHEPIPRAFCEKEAAKSHLHFEEGYTMLDTLFF